jgi:hypothetical protein
VGRSGDRRGREGGREGIARDDASGVEGVDVEGVRGPISGKKKWVSIESEGKNRWKDEKERRGMK